MWPQQINWNAFQTDWLWPDIKPMCRSWIWVTMHNCICIDQYQRQDVFCDGFFDFYHQNAVHDIGWPTINNVWATTWTERENHCSSASTATYDNIEKAIIQFLDLTSKFQPYPLKHNIMLPWANHQKPTKPCIQIIKPSCKNSNPSNTKWSLVPHRHHHCITGMDPHPPNIQHYPNNHKYHYYQMFLKSSVP